MGVSGGSSQSNFSQNTASQQAPPLWASEAGQQAVQTAQSLAQMPFAIPSQPIAPFQGQQAEAFQTIENLQGAYSPYITAGGALAGQGANAIFDTTRQYLPSAAYFQTPQGAAQYFNTEAAGVMPQMENIFGQQMAQTTGSAVQQAGGGNADRIALAQALESNQQGLSAGQTLSQLMQQSINQGQQAGVNLGNLGNINLQAGLGLGQTGATLGNLGNLGQTMGLSGAQAELGAGTLQQQQLQNQLNSVYNNVLQQIAWPFQTNAYLGSMASGVTPSMGGMGTSQTAGQVKSSNMGGSASLGGLGGAKGSTGGVVDAMRHGGRVGMAAGGNPVAGAFGSLDNMFAGNTGGMVLPKQMFETPKDTGGGSNPFSEINKMLGPTILARGGRAGFAGGGPVQHMKGGGTPESAIPTSASPALPGGMAAPLVLPAQGINHYGTTPSGQGSGSYYADELGGAGFGAMYDPKTGMWTDNATGAQSRYPPAAMPPTDVLKAPDRFNAVLNNMPFAVGDVPYNDPDQTWQGLSVLENLSHGPGGTTIGEPIVRSAGIGPPILGGSNNFADPFTGPGGSGQAFETNFGDIQPQGKQIYSLATAGESATDAAPHFGDLSGLASLFSGLAGAAPSGGGSVPAPASAPATGSLATYMPTVLPKSARGGRIGMEDGGALAGAMGSWLQGRGGQWGQGGQGWGGGWGSQAGQGQWGRWGGQGQQPSWGGGGGGDDDRWRQHPASAPAPPTTTTPAPAPAPAAPTQSFVQPSMFPTFRSGGRVPMATGGANPMVRNWSGMLQPLTASKVGTTTPTGMTNAQGMPVVTSSAYPGYTFLEDTSNLFIPFGQGTPAAAAAAPAAPQAAAAPTSATAQSIANSVSGSGMPITGMPFSRGDALPFSTASGSNQTKGSSSGGSGAGTFNPNFQYSTNPQLSDLSGIQSVLGQELAQTSPQMPTPGQTSPTSPAQFMAKTTAARGGPIHMIGGGQASISSPESNFQNAVNAPFGMFSQPPGGALPMDLGTSSIKPGSGAAMAALAKTTQAAAQAGKPKDQGKSGGQGGGQGGKGGKKQGQQQQDKQQDQQQDQQDDAPADTKQTAPTSPPDPNSGMEGQPAPLTGGPVGDQSGLQGLQDNASGMSFPTADAGMGLPGDGGGLGDLGGTQMAMADPGVMTDAGLGGGDIGGGDMGGGGMKGAARGGRIHMQDGGDTVYGGVDPGSTANVVEASPFTLGTGEVPYATPYSDFTQDMMRQASYPMQSQLYNMPFGGAGGAGGQQGQQGQQGPQSQPIQAGTPPTGAPQMQPQSPLPAFGQAPQQQQQQQPQQAAQVSQPVQQAIDAMQKTRSLQEKAATVAQDYPIETTPAGSTQVVSPHEAADKRLEEANRKLDFATAQVGHVAGLPPASQVLASMPMSDDARASLGLGQPQQQAAAPQRIDVTKSGYSSPIAWGRFGGNQPEIQGRDPGLTGQPVRVTLPDGRIIEAKQIGTYDGGADRYGRGFLGNEAFARQLGPNWRSAFPTGQRAIVSAMPGRPGVEQPGPNIPLPRPRPADEGMVGIRSVPEDTDLRAGLMPGRGGGPFANVPGGSGIQLAPQVRSLVDERRARIGPDRGFAGPGGPAGSLGTNYVGPSSEEEPGVGLKTDRLPVDRALQLAQPIPRPHPTPPSAELTPWSTMTRPSPLGLPQRFTPIQNFTPRPQQFSQADEIAPGSPAYDQYRRVTASIESGGNPRATTGSNYGTYQFGRRDLAALGLPSNRPFDPGVQEEALRRETARNTPILRNALGRNPTPAELYIAHQQGAAGGPELLRAAQHNPSGRADQTIRHFYPPGVAHQAIMGQAGIARHFGRMPTNAEFVQYWRDFYQRYLGRIFGRAEGGRTGTQDGGDPDDQRQDAIQDLPDLHGQTIGEIAERYPEYQQAMADQIRSDYPQATGASNQEIFSHPLVANRAFDYPSMRDFGTKVINRAMDAQARTAKAGTPQPARVMAQADTTATDATAPPVSGGTSPGFGTPKSIPTEKIRVPANVSDQTFRPPGSVPAAAPTTAQPPAPAAPAPAPAQRAAPRQQIPLPDALKAKGASDAEIAHAGWINQWSSFWGNDPLLGYKRLAMKYGLQSQFYDLQEKEDRWREHYNTNYSIEHSPEDAATHFTEHGIPAAVASQATSAPPTAATEATKGPGAHDPEVAAATTPSGAGNVAAAEVAGATAAGATAAGASGAPAPAFQPQPLMTSVREYTQQNGGQPPDPITARIIQDNADEKALHDRAQLYMRQGVAMSPQGESLMTQYMNSRATRMHEYAAANLTNRQAAMAGMRFVPTPEGMHVFDMIGGGHQFFPTEGGASVPQGATRSTAPGAVQPQAVGTPSLLSPTPMSQQPPAPVRPLPVDPAAAAQQRKQAREEPAQSASHSFPDPAFVAAPLPTRADGYRGSKAMSSPYAPLTESALTATRAELEKDEPQRAMTRDALAALEQYDLGVQAAASKGLLAPGQLAPEFRKQAAEVLQSALRSGGFGDDSVAANIINRIADPGQTITASQLDQLRSRLATTLLSGGGAGGYRAARIFETAKGQIPSSGADAPTIARTLGALKAALEYKRDYIDAKKEFAYEFNSTTATAPDGKQVNFDTLWDQSHPFEQYAMKGIAEGAVDDRYKKFTPADANWVRTQQGARGYEEKLSMLVKRFHLEGSPLIPYLQRH